MTAQSQNSVLYALSELQQIETQRVAEELAREAEQRRQAEEAARREREARLQTEQHQQRVAEAEARLRVAEELRVSEIQQRAQRLEHELRVVQAERGLLSDSLSRVEQVPDKPPPRAFVIGAALLLLLGGTAAGALALSRYPEPQRRIPVERAPLPTPPIVDSKYAQQLAEIEARLNKILAERPSDKATARALTAPPSKRPTPANPRRGERPNLNVKDCEDDPLGCLHIR